MSEEVTQTLDAITVTTVACRAHEAATVSGRSERGMVSAEWAVGIIAAVALAGVLFAVVTNGAVKTALLRFVLMVIHAFSANLG